MMCVPHFRLPSCLSAAWLLVAVFGLGLPACSSDDVPSSPAPASANTSEPLAYEPPVPDPHLTPLDTLRRVHRYRMEGRMRHVGLYVIPEQREAVVEHILSVDELTSAGESLKQRIERHVGAGSAEAFDRTQVANALGPFSRDVEFVSAIIEGDTAIARIRIAGRLPLEATELVRRDGCWLIRTDPPVAGVSAELRKLAKVLLRVAEQVERKKLTAVQIGDELALRQRPILDRIDQLVAAADTSETVR